MKTKTISIIILSLLVSTAAEARRKKRRVKKAKPMMNEAAVAELVGDFKFGMTQKQVVSIVAKQLAEKYQVEISATTNTYEQDVLRKRRDREVTRFKKSLVKFNGKRTGWDVSVIDDQFRHKLGESMLVSSESSNGKTQKRFFFFHHGKLYKMYITVNEAKLANAKFDAIAGVLVNRYGSPSKKVGDEIVWTGKKISLSAFDKLRFYDTFALSITDNALKSSVLASWKANPKPKEKKDRVIESVTNQDYELKMDTSGDHLKNL